MNDIEKAIEVQDKLIQKWNERVSELEEVIEKYPWHKMNYDFGDWRQSELKRRKQQIETAKTTISALEKQMPKKILSLDGLNETRCPRCNFVYGYEIDEYDDEKVDYCFNCGQKLDWEVEE